MRSHRLTLVGAAVAALSCSRAPAAPNAGPAPASTPPTASAARTDSAVRRVPFSTATVTQGPMIDGFPAGPRARMENRSIPPRVLIADSTFSVGVMVGADGKPRMETLRLHAGATPEQREAARAWLEAATFTMPTQDGAPIAAPYQVRGRAAMSAMMRSATANVPLGTSGEVIGEVRGTSDARAPMMPSRPGELTLQQMSALAPRVARLRSDLDTLFVRPGERVWFNQTLRIAAFDSSDAFLGYVTRYGSLIRAMVFEIDGRSVMARAEGVELLRLSWPRASWTGRTDLPVWVEIPVVSAARVTDAMLDRQRTASGSGSGSCELARRDILCRSMTVSRGTGPTETQSLKMLVLHRSASFGLVRRAAADSAANAARERVYRQASRDAEDRGRLWIGGLDANDRPIGIEVKHFSDSIWIGDQAFVAHWHRDSAVVVMWDTRPGASAVPRRTVIPSTLPDGIEAKSWVSGDTTFMVRPRDVPARWSALLDRFPAIAEFLRP